MKIIIESTDLEAAFEGFCDDMLDHCSTVEDVKKNMETVEGAAAMVQYILDTYVSYNTQNSSENVNAALERFKNITKKVI